MRPASSSTWAAILESNARSAETAMPSQLPNPVKSSTRPPVAWAVRRTLVPMLSRVDVRGRKDDLRAVLARPDAGGDDLRATVAAILAEVRSGGDAAVREFTRRFDGCDPVLRLPADTPARALDAIPADLRTALELAADQIR